MRIPREQALAQIDDDNPAYINGQRIWLAYEFALGLMGDRVYKENKNRPKKIGCDLHWRVNLNPPKDLLE